MSKYNPMIKKNTKIIFPDDNIKELDNLSGGMPLTKGEIIHIRQDNNKATDYIVADKNIDILLEGDDQIVNITYILKKK